MLANNLLPNSIPHDSNSLNTLFQFLRFLGRGEELVQVTISSVKTGCFGTLASRCLNFSCDLRISLLNLRRSSWPFWTSTSLLNLLTCRVSLSELGYDSWRIVKDCASKQETRSIARNPSCYLWIGAGATSLDHPQEWQPSHHSSGWDYYENQVHCRLRSKQQCRIIRITDIPDSYISRFSLRIRFSSNTSRIHSLLSLTFLPKTSLTFTTFTINQEVYPALSDSAGYI